MDEQRKTAFPLLDHAPKNSIHDQLDKFRGFGARLVRNKKLLSVCDQLLAACFVTPITVMIWAAVWALIDVFYARYFPVYPSLFMAFCIIISFSIVREVLQLTIKDDESCWWKHTLYFIVKLVYMHVFFVCNILTWRGSWAFMFDYMEPYGIGFLMAVSIGCVVLLCCLKCMKNTLASPFVLVVDSDSLFDFPSRFKTRALLLAYLLTSTAELTSAEERQEQTLDLVTVLPPHEEQIPEVDLTTPVANDNDTIVIDQEIAEKLTLEESLDELTRNDQIPSPFIRKLRGPPPMEFTTSTHKYPQLLNYRNPFPKNIQDIITYISPNHPTRDVVNGVMAKYQNPPSEFFSRYRPTQLHPFFVKAQNDLRKKAVNRLKDENAEDPFFSYKPQEPGDINLLATASFRFSPPAWANFNPASNFNLGSKPSPSIRNELKQSAKERKPNERKPLTVTLNVFPMENEYAASNHFDFPGINASRYVPEENSVKPKKLKPNKMVIHLNLFPAAADEYEKKRRVGN